MKEGANWILKNIAIPLTPFFIGAILRYIYTGKLSAELFNESELALSMGLLCIIMIKSTKKIQDEILGDNISYVLMMFTLAFIVFFACTSFLQFHINIKTEHQIMAIVDLLKSGTLNLKAQEIYTPKSDEFYGMLSTFRNVTFILSLITIPTVIIFKHKYNID